MTLKLLVLPGDGIGPEITAATLEVLKAADAEIGLGLDFELQDIGLKSLAERGTTLPDAVMKSVPQADGVILGPVSHNEYPSRDKGGINPSGELRTKFELYANIRPCRSREGLTILRKPWTSSWCARTPKGSIPTATCSPGQGSSCPIRTWRFPSARSPPKPRRV